MRDHLDRLVFIDETSLKTNMTKATGWAPVGDRLVDHAPAGRWNTQTFIAGLRPLGRFAFADRLPARHDRIDATGIINGAMDKDMFDLYVEGILAPTLRPGDVVILDNLPVHRSTAAADILREVGAWFLFLPKYSPDLNPASRDICFANTLPANDRNGILGVDYRTGQDRIISFSSSSSVDPSYPLPLWHP